MSHKLPLPWQIALVQLIMPSWGRLKVGQTSHLTQTELEAFEALGEVRVWRLAKPRHDRRFALKQGARCVQPPHPPWPRLSVVLV